MGELSTWARVRRFAVPWSMIERAVAAREAGDWRVACDVSHVDVDQRERAAQTVRHALSMAEQIDELAAAAGLHLDARYATWRREPFGPDSGDHISVYRKP